MSVPVPPRATKRRFPLKLQTFTSAASLLPEMRGRDLRSVLLHMSRPMTA